MLSIEKFDKKTLQKKFLTHYALRFLSLFLLFTFHYSLLTAGVNAEELNLKNLIGEALKNNHEILMAESKWKTSDYKIQQAKSLPDPMVMFGYQNEGWRRYSYGEMEGAQWMFSAAQTLPFPGKLSLKGEMASRDSDSLRAYSESVRLKTIARVRELYDDLFLAYKNIDLIKEKASLFSRIEDSAVARYSAGMGQQQEVLMAQTEKYMLLEREEMFRQKIQAIEAMLNTTVGNDINSPLGRPAELTPSAYAYSMDELVQMAYGNSPEIKAREKMIASAETKVFMAEKDYYPDFTVTANLYKRSGQFEDMWSITTAINVPIFYKTKQEQAVNEAKSLLSEARHELQATKLMLASAIKDNYSMLKSAEKLIDVYRDALIPRTLQDFDLYLSAYVAGKAEAMTVISRLKALIDYETLYWGQLVEREKAIARLEAITAIKPQGQGR